MDPMLKPCQHSQRRKRGKRRQREDREHDGKNKAKTEQVKHGSIPCGATPAAWISRSHPVARAFPGRSRSPLQQSVRGLLWSSCSSAVPCRRNVGSAIPDTAVRSKPQRRNKLCLLCGGAEDLFYKDGRAWSSAWCKQAD